MAVRYLFLLLLLLPVSLSGCSGRDNGQAAVNGKVNVAVSIEPVAAFVEAVGKERVQVTVMVPGGASPHTYEPKPSQLRSLGSALLYAKVGSGIEFERRWMARLEKLNPRLVITDCSKGVELLSAPTAKVKAGKEAAHQERSGDGSDAYEERAHTYGFDPHIWVSPRNAVKMVENIYAGLVEVDPEGREAYRANKDEYIKKLQALDKKIRALLSGKRGARVITYHPAWGYLTAEYGLVEVPVEFEGKPPSSRSVVEIIKRARNEHVTTVFTSVQFSRRAAEVIAKEIGGKVVSLNPLERNYIENMERVATAFSKL